MFAPPNVFDRSAAVIVDFPLRGEWQALNTPVHRVPSHGTDYFGQRYAFDFVRLDAQGISCRPRSVLQHLTIGAPAPDFYCWDEPVTAAFSGRVVATGDSWPDRSRVAALWELLRSSLFPPLPTERDYRPLAGNFVAIEGTPGVALYAHLRCGSLRVTVGQHVAAGVQIGSVGNSGNSTMPHLHFQLMDGRDPLRAKGVACVFRHYERFANGEWTAVVHDAPGRLERIRAV